MLARIRADESAAFAELVNRRGPKARRVAVLSGAGSDADDVVQEAFVNCARSTRPAELRRQGKTDQLDAYRAARSVLSGEARTDPKLAWIEPLRDLNVARRSAVKSQQAAWRQIQALLVNAPAGLRDHYRDLSDARLAASLANSRPDQLTDPDIADIRYALRVLARRHRDLTEQSAGLEARMLARATTANPALMSIKGVGAVIGAQLLITVGDNPDRLRSSASFAALCATAPIPVSSGRTDRHRLSRDGDRQANAALHHIAEHLGVWPARISELELGRGPNNELATRYRA